MSPFFSNVLFSDLVEKALSSLLGCPLSTLLNTHLFYHQSAACVCVCVCGRFTCCPSLSSVPCVLGLQDHC